MSTIARGNTFLPAPGFILVKIDEKKDGEILIAKETGKYQATEGEVVAVGKQKITSFGGVIPSPVGVGDFVVFSPHGVAELVLENEQYRIVEFEKIKGVLK